MPRNLPPIDLKLVSRTFPDFWVFADDLRHRLTVISPPHGHHSSCLPLAEAEVAERFPLADIFQQLIEPLTPDAKLTTEECRDIAVDLSENWNGLEAVKTGYPVEELLVVYECIILVELSDLPDDVKQKIRGLQWKYGTVEGREVGAEGPNRYWSHAKNLADFRLDRDKGREYTSWKNIEDDLEKRIRRNASFKSRFKSKVKQYCVPS
jgi:hypothetical protein